MSGSRYADKNQREQKSQKEKKGKKKGSVFGRVFGTLILVAAVCVFCYSAYELYGYYREYKAGTDEYGSLNDQFVQIEPTGGEEPSLAGETKATEPLSGIESSENGGDASTQQKERPNRLVTTEKSEEGPVLANVAELEEEDENLLEGKIEEAGKVEAVENGEEKNLPMLRNPINFQELNAINEDIIGWLRIRALDVSYPIAQAEDNDYYLHRTFAREDNFAGCIFLNCTNSKYFTDQNSIVYGHNMKNGSMFGTLKKFQDQEVYDDCPYFWIFTPEFIYQYRIFSCSVVSKIGDPYRTRFLTSDFEEFIRTCQENSMIDNGGMEVTTNDRIVTLSTCTGDESTRFIVQGKLAHLYASR